MFCLGIDTSNYTTSAALYNMQTGEVSQRKRLLPVAHGKQGLRQSDAVFAHTVQLPEVIESLLQDFSGSIKAVGVSKYPRGEVGSYMPCFLPGISVARSLSAALKIPLHGFSHQAGHIAAALYSSNKLSLMHEVFLAFHVSGGTTEAVLVHPDKEFGFKTEIVAKTLDLKAGQAIDRIGVMLGLDFPAGASLDVLTQSCKESFKIRPTMKECDCCLSGIENQCAAMYKKEYPKEEIAAYCIESVYSALAEMTRRLLKKYGNLPLVFSGGVMCNSLMRSRLSDEFAAFFAKPEFSSDNAAGIAVLTAYREARA